MQNGIYYGIYMTCIDDKSRNGMNDIIKFQFDYHCDLKMYHIMNFNTLFVWACHMVSSIFVPIGLQLPVK